MLVHALPRASHSPQIGSTADANTYESKSSKKAHDVPLAISRSVAPLQGIRNVTDSVASKPAPDVTAGRDSPSPFHQPSQCEGFQAISTQHSGREPPRQSSSGVKYSMDFPFQTRLRIWFAQTTPDCSALCAQMPSNSPVPGANGRHFLWPAPVQGTMLDSALMATHLGISCRRGRTSVCPPREIAVFGPSRHLLPRQARPIKPAYRAGAPSPLPPAGGAGGVVRTGQLSPCFQCPLKCRQVTNPAYDYVRFLPTRRSGLHPYCLSLSGTPCLRSTDHVRSDSCSLSGKGGLLCPRTWQRAR